MRIELRYGEAALPLEVPERNRPWVVHSGVVPPGTEPRRELDDALSHPFGTPPLEQLAHGKRQACIVISDNTRSSPSPLFVEGILERIAKRVPRVQVLVATGLHAPLERSAMETLIGPGLAARCDLVSHDARNVRDLVALGASPRGIPVYINRHFLGADLRILTGVVEPHFMAGYSGGRKSVCPGIVGEKTIQFVHSPLLLESPCADYCVLAGNPVHEEALWVARAIGVDFIVNATLDSESKVTGIVAGDLEAAWLECVGSVSLSAQAVTSGRYDVVVTSNGGYPLDRNYYQTVKGLVAAARIVKPGGIIVMASECRDGLGSDSFRKALQTLIKTQDLDEYVTYISKEENWIIDQWEVEMLVKVLRLVSAILVCSRGIRTEDLPLTCAEPVSSLQEGLKEAQKRLGPHVTLAVMPEGPHVIPAVRAAAIMADSAGVSFRSRRGVTSTYEAEPR